MADAAPTLLDRQHFAVRRIHSLLGIVPVGAFLINHMLANATAFLGEEHFNHHIELIHSLPFLVYIEWLFIIIPIAIHAVYGVVIALQARGNQFKYPYADNWRFALQRITAYITLIFIVLHLVHYRFADWFGIAGSYAAAHHAPGGFYKFTIESFQAGLMGIPTEAWVAIYVIGFLAAIYHFCNGIVTFCITWGFVIGDDSRKRVSLVAFALGGLLCLWAGLSIYALATVDPSLMDVQPGLDLQKAIQDLAEQTTG